MKYILLILTCIVLSTQISCESDLSLDIPDEESKVVINSLLGSDSLLRVHITNSSILNTNNINVENAKVQIKENNTVLKQLINTENGWYTLENTYLKSNNTYQIEISHPNFETCTAETEVPEKVLIKQINYQKKYANQLDFTIVFQNDPSQENYYMILLKGKQDNKLSDIEYNSDDIIFNGNLSINSIGLQQNILRGSRSFSDENRNGNEISISFYVYNELIDINQLFSEYQVTLYHITQDYYKYERSLITFNNREDVPFYNKVNLHSNVTNGYGIFTSYAADSKSINIE
ncbi:MAG: DUF4249 domain-containing protein [Labilibaculum sp.]|nr:DUF4249 domain-containing protein [Labilibaculum sp.]MBI9058578.1 DUF4249 domain-containing protein [Labilibaculum sp.]